VNIAKGSEVIVNDELLPNRDLLGKKKKQKKKERKKSLSFSLFLSLDVSLFLHQKKKKQNTVFNINLVFTLNLF